jgi:hypothetical protein
MQGELALVENELKRVRVPRPISFAWSGNNFGPEALRVLGESGYRLARRGGQPEVEYGKQVIGPAYDASRHHPLLIPTTGDNYPEGTLEHFRQVVEQAREGRIAVLQFHGVPDLAHPWVHTPPERFREYMHYLKDQGFQTLALQDLEPFVNRSVSDPTTAIRYPKSDKLMLPVEREATLADLGYWEKNMSAHGYTAQEAELVTGRSAFGRQGPVPAQWQVLPYPGGRPVRIGFREGAINPLRGTKASVFLPTGGYAVIDLPEAIFSGQELLFLAHTHVPTIWNDRNVIIENSDWDRRPDGGLSSRWTLPNGVSFGAEMNPGDREVAMKLWLRNGTDRPLSKLRTQICLLLKEARGLNVQTNDNKSFGTTVAEVRGTNGPLRIEWERCGRTWGNAACPCMHSDPILPDCAPGETVQVRGRVW